MYYSAETKSSFKILPDGEYEYNYIFEIARKKSFGSWNKIKKNIISLNSKYQSRILPLSCVDCSWKKELKGNEILVDIPENLNGSYEFLFYINDTIIKTGNKISPIRLYPVLKFDSLTVAITGQASMPSRFLDTLYTTKFYKRGNQNFLHFKISYNDSLFNYKVFNSQKIKYNSNSINMDGIYFKRQ